MRQALRLHPDSHCEALSQIEVRAVRASGGGLALHFLVTGRVSELLLPAPARSARADGLWRHTCFEAFVRTPSGTAYHEFNFAPSTEWAAYRFDGYRSGMSVAESCAPQIASESKVDRYELQVRLDLRNCVPPDAAWQIGLSAVMEEKTGTTSYWALAHPPGRPDFHHADCFALEIPRPWSDPAPTEIPRPDP